MSATCRYPYGLKVWATRRGFGVVIGQPCRNISDANALSKLSVYGLDPGDVIITVLPAVSASAGSVLAPGLRAGDVLESEIEGLGVMRNKVVAEGGNA